MADTALPPPRDPDWLKAELRRLHAQRDRHQDSLVGDLRSIDAIDDLITARLDELARALPPEVPRA